MLEGVGPIPRVDRSRAVSASHEVLKPDRRGAAGSKFTLRWLIGSLPHPWLAPSLLGVIAMVPVVCDSLPVLLITVLAVQIVLGYRTPECFARPLIGTVRLPSSYLRSLEQTTIPFLTGSRLGRPNRLAKRACTALQSGRDVVGV